MVVVAGSTDATSRLLRSRSGPAMAVKANPNGAPNLPVAVRRRARERGGSERCRESVCV